MAASLLRGRGVPRLRRARARQTRAGWKEPPQSGADAPGRGPPAGVQRHSCNSALAPPRSTHPPHPQFQNRVCLVSATCLWLWLSLHPASSSLSSPLGKRIPDPRATSVQLKVDIWRRQKKSTAEGDEPLGATPLLSRPLPGWAGCPRPLTPADPVPSLCCRHRPFRSLNSGLCRNWDGVGAVGVGCRLLKQDPRHRQV